MCRLCWRCVIERIEALIVPATVAELASRDEHSLRTLKNEASAVENAVSYLRRLAQARTEIMDAEAARRARGGSVAELIAELPKILGGDAARGNAANSRFVEPDSAILELSWPDRRERLVTNDDALAALPVLTDDELASKLEQIQAFERELSDDRRRLHAVIDAVEHELATRAAANL